MFLDDEPPISGGREIWGFPKSTPIGRKHENRASDHGGTLAALGKLSIYLKLIPDVDGRAKIAQLVGYAMEDITVTGCVRN
jgi:acetoacetate decarboxylase